MIISLTGFMGCGKSSVGRRLSELLCCRYVDLDSVIEKKTGRSIREIFASEGEDVFRRMELEALKSLLRKDNQDKMVISLGGGTIMTRECAELVRNNTLCIYLRASVDTLVMNLKDEAAGRPLLADSCDLRRRIESMMEVRSYTYENTAHIIIDTDNKSIEKIAEEIVSRI